MKLNLSRLCSGVFVSLLFVTLTQTARGAGTFTQLPLPEDQYTAIKLSGNGEVIILRRIGGSVWSTDRAGISIQQEVPPLQGADFDVDYSGQKLCLEVRDAIRGRAQVLVRSPINTEDIVIGETGTSSAKPRISGNGERVFFASDLYNPTGFYVRPTDGSAPARYFGVPADALEVSYSGRRVVYLTGNPTQVWGAELMDDGSWVHHQITQETSGASRILVSGDGERVAYVTSPQRGTLALRIVLWNGSEQSTVFQGAGEVQLSRLSYDGNVVNFVALGADLLVHPFLASTNGQVLVRMDRSFAGNSPISSMDASGTTIVLEQFDFVQAIPSVFLWEAPLSIHGNATPGATLTLRIAYPQEPYRRYLLGGSFSTSPGFALPDGRTIPLTPDRLMTATLRQSGSVFNGFRGRLDSRGVGVATIHFPVAVTPGTRFFVGGITATGPSLRVVNHITEPVGITVLPPLLHALQ